MPPANVLDSARPAPKNAISVCTSRSTTGRRYARRATFERIFDAHGFSSAALAGSQTKIERRAGLVGLKPSLDAARDAPELIEGPDAPYASRAFGSRRYGPPICTAPTLA